MYNWCSSARKCAKMKYVPLINWIQVPIPSYLLAIVVGALEKRNMSDRCAIWAEPSIVDKAHYEFRWGHTLAFIFLIQLFVFLNEKESPVVTEQWRIVEFSDGGDIENGGRHRGAVRLGTIRHGLSAALVPLRRHGKTLAWPSLRPHWSSVFFNSPFLMFSIQWSIHHSL